MMYKIQNIKYLIRKDVKITDCDLIDYVTSYLKNKHYKDISDVKLIKKSLDARHTDLYYILAATFSSKDSKKVLLKNPNITIYKESEELKKLKLLKQKTNKHVFIVGMGPSGLFSAYLLNQAGYNVTIIDRGANVEKRVEIVEEFFKSGKLDINTNIEFGEGGAGTFSDGKLATNINSPYISFILETFVKYGANQNILYESKPHIGTDILRKVLVNMRNDLISKGVKFLFETRLIDFDNVNKIAIVLNETKTYEYKYDYLILAVGHCAKDIYELLKKKNADMEPKPFSLGIRIEHLQKDINTAQYKGCYPYLDSADYKIVKHLKDRSVYSFCMCPGGFVVNASSDEGYLHVNGMSNFSRDNVNANSAILVNVNVDDYYKKDILDGINFQKTYEKKAYDYSLSKGYKYYVPIQKLEDFLNNKETLSIGKIKPTVKPGYVMSNLQEILPAFVVDALREAIPQFEKNIKGFSDGDAILSAVESRSSAAIRIKRNDELMTSLDFVYAIGEGSGYAGGITTSALDGLKIAVKIIEKEVSNE